MFWCRAAGYERFSPDTLGKAKPVTFYQSTYDLICEQEARTNIDTFLSAFDSYHGRG